ncbi:vegetative cell wall protein gp1-like [Schistocerca americana]|uniref:vegetative cell wall protein gp1-like n=1 Tax=Schistocerca americana TaxID=7009 RepID=UPI001F4FC536|nr:vegetative cell wall protein gp1-like [Schistocerca americana]
MCLLALVVCPPGPPPCARCCCSHPSIRRPPACSPPLPEDSGPCHFGHRCPATAAWRDSPDHFHHLPEGLPPPHTNGSFTAAAVLHCCHRFSFPATTTIATVTVISIAVFTSLSYAANMAYPTNSLIFTSPSAVPTTVTWNSSATPIPVLPSLPVHPTLAAFSAVTTPNSPSPVAVAPSPSADLPPLPAPPSTGSNPARISARRFTVSVPPTLPPSASSAPQGDLSPAISPCKPSTSPLSALSCP